MGYYLLVVHLDDLWARKYGRAASFDGNTIEGAEWIAGKEVEKWGDRLIKARKGGGQAKAQDEIARPSGVREMLIQRALEQPTAVIWQDLTANSSSWDVYDKIH
jgi:hypothetical protein